MKQKWTEKWKKVEKAKVRKITRTGDGNKVGIRGNKISTREN